MCHIITAGTKDCYGDDDIIFVIIIIIIVIVGLSRCDSGTFITLDPCLSQFLAPCWKLLHFIYSCSYLYCCFSLL